MVSKFVVGYCEQALWESTLHQVLHSSHYELPNWGGGTLKQKKMIGINTNWQKGTGTKGLKNWTNLKNLKKKKSDFSPVLNPDTFWWLARCPRVLNHRFGGC